MPTGCATIYLHVPFCLRRCPYCDFAITVTRSIPHDAYLAAVVEELEQRAHELAGRRLLSVYLGGGTPGLWRTDCVEAFLDAVRAKFAVGADTEITIELNPEDLDATRASELAAAGVNRASLGVQSLDAAALSFLGRQHTGDTALRAVELLLAAGVSNVSADVIYGLPDESPERGAKDVRRLAAAGVSHLSAYELTIEPGTSFGARVRRGALRPVGEDAAIEAADATHAALEAEGFARYEVSNFARMGARSVHNSAYWAGHEYLGLGVGAHSLRLEAGFAVRRANTRATSRYLEGGDRAAPELETLDAGTHLRECVMMQLRTTDGVDTRRLAQRFGSATDWLPGLCERWAAAGWGRWAAGVFRPGPEGLRMADSLAGEAFGA